jgi:hypothetical protein
MKKLTTLFALFFLLAYHTAQAQFKPEQFEGSWDVDCASCEEDLTFTFNLVNKEGETPAFAKERETYHKFLWNVLGGKFLVLNVEMRSPEGIFIRTEIFNVLSITNDEIKMQGENIMKYGDAPSLQSENLKGDIFTLHKRKKGKLTYKPQGDPPNEPEEKK